MAAQVSPKLASIPTLNATTTSSSALSEKDKKEQLLYALFQQQLKDFSHSPFQVPFSYDVLVKQRYNAFIDTLNLLDPKGKVTPLIKRLLIDLLPDPAAQDNSLSPISSETNSNGLVTLLANSTGELDSPLYERIYQQLEKITRLQSHDPHIVDTLAPVHYNFFNQTITFLDPKGVVSPIINRLLTDLFPYDRMNTPSPSIGLIAKGSRVVHQEMRTNQQTENYKVDSVVAAVAESIKGPVYCDQ